MPYRVIITGCRNWEPLDLARRVCEGLKRKHGHVQIVHGGATGIDRTFGRAAIEAGMNVYPFAADWDRYGKSAGPKRNQAMIDSRADLCLAFHRDFLNSKGTLDCVRRALRAGIPVWLVSSEDGKPVRVTDDICSPYPEGR